MSEIYKRHFYINKDIDQKVNEEIIEYDMKSAGLSIIKSGKLLDERMISLLEILPKDQRSIKIGNLQKRDKELTRKLNEGFEYYRKVFLESNDVKDDDIISIKKDAIFTTKRCKNMEFDYVKLVEGFEHRVFLHGTVIYDEEEQINEYQLTLFVQEEDGEISQKLPCYNHNIVRNRTFVR